MKEKKLIMASREYKQVLTRIKMARQLVGLTQFELARILYTTDLTLRNHELGKTIPDLIDMFIFFKATNISPSFVFGIEGIDPKDWCNEYRKELQQRLDEYVEPILGPRKELPPSAIPDNYWKNGKYAGRVKNETKRVWVKKSKLCKNEENE